MAGGKHLLGKVNGRHIFGTVKVGEKGQIVIPKEARDQFGIRRGIRCWCSATIGTVSWSRVRTLSRTLRSAYSII